MNEEQKCIAVVEAGHNLLITGQCGTGKIYTLRKMVQALKPKKVAVTALTRIASLQYGEVGGQTIHHWCGYMDCRHSATELEDLLLQNDAFHDAKQNILSTDVLIIDEIGMMSDKMFQTVENLCSAIRRDRRPFGGIQVIASGDFKQLPPVPNHYQDDDGSFVFQSDMFRRVFPHLVNLKKVLRQTEADLISAINELRDGRPTESTHNLMDRLRRPLSEGQPEPIKLYGTNFEVEFENFSKMNEMPGEVHLFKSKDSGETNLLVRSQAKHILKLKIGSPVILIRNLTSQLVNGRQGVVHSIQAEGPIIDFDGKLVQVRPMIFEIYDVKQKRVRATRSQVPLRLAHAITVHRAQGLNLPSVVINCETFFLPGQLGVAVGRCVSKNSLQILNYDRTKAGKQHKAEVYEYYDQESAALEDDLSCCSTIPLPSGHDLVAEGEEDSVSDCDEKSEISDTNSSETGDISDDEPMDEMEKERINAKLTGFITSFEKGGKAIPEKTGDLCTYYAKAEKVVQKLLTIRGHILSKTEHWQELCKKLTIFLNSEGHKKDYEKLFSKVEDKSFSKKTSTKMYFIFCRILFTCKQVSSLKLKVNYFLTMGKK